MSKFKSEPYVYIDRPLLTSFGTERLASDSYGKLMLSEVGPFRVGEGSPSTVTIDGDGRSNSVSIYCMKFAPTPTTLQHVMKGDNKGNKDELPTSPMRQNAL